MWCSVKLLSSVGVGWCYVLPVVMTVCFWSYLGEIVQDNWHFETSSVDVHGEDIGHFGERSICLMLAGVFGLDLMFRCLCNDGQLCGCAMVVAERRSWCNNYFYWLISCYLIEVCHVSMKLWLVSVIFLFSDRLGPSISCKVTNFAGAIWAGPRSEH